VNVRTLLVCAGLLSLGGACDTCRDKPRAALLADAAPPPSLDEPIAQPHPRFASHPFWLAARSEDPLDLAALAEIEGATGLLEGLEQGGQVGRTALHAMQYADDAELAYRRLAQIALQTTDETQLDVLLALEHIGNNAPLAGEPLDPDGPEFCIQALLTIVGGSSPAANRHVAVAALHAFARRGAVNPAQIPPVD